MSTHGPAPTSIASPIRHEADRRDIPRAPGTLPDKVSVSQIQAYLTCPLKFRFRYVDKVESAWKSAGLVLGTSVHAAIAWLAEQRMKGVEAIEVEEVLRIFRADLEAQFMGPVLTKDGEMVEDLACQGAALLRLWIENPSPGKVVGAEVSFEVDVVHPETGEILPKPLVGFIDLVEESVDGSSTIIEVKTAARRWSEDDLARNIQATAYHYAYGVVAGQSPKVRFDVLLKTKTPRLERHGVERGPKDHVRFFALATEVLRSIEAGAFHPIPGWPCAECEYAAHCPVGV